MSSCSVDNDRYTLSSISRSHAVVAIAHGRYKVSAISPVASSIFSHYALAKHLGLHTCSTVFGLNTISTTSCRPSIVSAAQLYFRRLRRPTIGSSTAPASHTTAPRPRTGWTSPSSPMSTAFRHRTASTAPPSLISTAPGPRTVSSTAVRYYKAYPTFQTSYNSLATCSPSSHNVSDVEQTSHSCQTSHQLSRTRALESRTALRTADFLRWHTVPIALHSNTTTRPAGCSRLINSESIVSRKWMSLSVSLSLNNNRDISLSVTQHQGHLAIGLNIRAMSQCQSQHQHNQSSVLLSVIRTAVKSSKD